MWVPEGVSWVPKQAQLAAAELERQAAGAAVAAARARMEDMGAELSAARAAAEHAEQVPAAAASICLYLHVTT